MKQRKLWLLSCTLLWFAFGCINIAGDCQTTVSKRLINKSGTLQAVSETTDCGATTTPSSGLKIIEGNDLNDLGTPDNTILGSNGGFDFYWKADDTLFVMGADTTGGFVMKPDFNLTKKEGRVIIVYSENDTR